MKTQVRIIMKSVFMIAFAFIMLAGTGGNASAQTTVEKTSISGIPVSITWGGLVPDERKPEFKDAWKKILDEIETSYQDTLRFEVITNFALPSGVIARTKPKRILTSVQGRTLRVTSLKLKLADNNNLNGTDFDAVFYINPNANWSNKDGRAIWEQEGLTATGIGSTLHKETGSLTFRDNNEYYPFDEAMRTQNNLSVIDNYSTDSEIRDLLQNGGGLFLDIGGELIPLYSGENGEYDDQVGHHVSRIFEKTLNQIMIPFYVLEQRYDRLGWVDRKILSNVLGYSLKHQFPFPPTGGFSVNKQNLSISITEETSGTVIDRGYDFGDGETSRDANPTHEYQTPGTYTIKQWVQNYDGVDTVSKQITVTNDPIMNVDPLSISVGTKQAGASFSETFAITNNGGGTLVATLSESSSIITSLSETNVSLTAGQSITITVGGTFPSATGAFSENITVSSTQVDDQTVTVSGTTEAAPSMLITPTTIDAGKQQASVPFSKTFTIENNGGGTLNVTITENSNIITSLSEASASLTAGQSVSVTVNGTFPTSTGDFTANISVSSTQVDDQTVTVSGTTANVPLTATTRIYGVPAGKSFTVIFLNASESQIGTQTVSSMKEIKPPAGTVFIDYVYTKGSNEKVTVRIK